jgi:hypothetical protein
MQSFQWLTLSILQVGILFCVLMLVKVITVSRDDTFFLYLAAVQNCWLPENVGLVSDGACIWNVRLISSSYQNVCLKHP